MRVDPAFDATAVSRLDSRGRLSPQRSISGTKLPEGAKPTLAAEFSPPLELPGCRTALRPGRGHVAHIGLPCLSRANKASSRIACLPPLAARPGTDKESPLPVPLPAKTP